VRSSRPTIRLSDSFLTAVFEQARVSGMPHSIYRYPARFSPAFARQAILSFTDVGELVLDPFTGGGTAITEAMALARRAACLDISSLATFLIRVKTTPLSIHDTKAIKLWAIALPGEDEIKSSTFAGREREARHLTDEAYQFFKTILLRTDKLRNRRQKDFVRLVLLATGQSALDCKAMLPSTSTLLSEFRRMLELALIGFRRFWHEVAGVYHVPPGRVTQFRRILRRSCTGCESDRRIPYEWLPAKLVLTSPPYPGVHVLYHRWQILGRRETSAAFWIANQNDGAGESYYTFGSRQQPGLRTYFRNLRETFSSIRVLVDHASTVVQLVGFSAPDWQLPAYLATMKATGFEEVLPECERTALFRRRVWRNIPSRRWYACIEPEITSSREVLLFHRAV